MRNIQSVSDNYMCSSCGACKAVCAKSAISFKYTSIGRKYAFVNGECTDCGMCLKVCPSIDYYNLYDTYEDRLLGEIQQLSIGRATDTYIYENSQSGGVATMLLKYLFEKGLIDGALVCKMTVSENPEAQGYIAYSIADLLDSQKSCYTPVDLLSELRNIRHLKSLAVVGLPCHIEGVCNLIRILKKMNNITYKIGLICDRTLCKGIQDVFLSFDKTKCHTIHWRRKNLLYSSGSYTYEHAPVVVVGKNDRVLKIFPNSYRHDLKEMFTPPRCRVCYDKLNVHADIVLGDPWLMPDVDKKNGDSLIIVRTDKGFSLLSSAIDDKYISISSVGDSLYDSFLVGQHVEQRRELVASFSNAMIGLLANTDETMPLLHDKYARSISLSVSAEDIEVSKQKIRDFISMEQKCNKDIVCIGRSIIKMNLKNDRRRNSRIWCSYIKVRTFLGKVKRRIML